MFKMVIPFVSVLFVAIVIAAGAGCSSSEAASGETIRFIKMEEMTIVGCVPVDEPSRVVFCEDEVPALEVSVSSTCSFCKFDEDDVEPITAGTRLAQR